MQVMPGTYAEMRSRYGLGDDPYHPYDSIMAGAAYIREMYDLYGSPAFLAAYNAGPGRVAKLGRIPDIRETQAYVTAVVDCYLALSAGRGVRSARECRLPEATR